MSPGDFRFFSPQMSPIPPFFYPYNMISLSLKRANRAQIRLVPMDLESSLPQEHAARLIWEFVEQLDLRPLYAQIRAVEGHPGQNAIEPKILMALWLCSQAA